MYLIENNMKKDDGSFDFENGGIYDVMIETELQLFRISEEIYDIRKEESFNIINESIDGQKNGNKMFQKVVNIFNVIKKGFLKAITTVKDFIKKMYNKVFNTEGRIEKKALEKNTPYNYKGYPIIKYCEKPILRPYQFCGKIGDVMKGAKITKATEKEPNKYEDTTLEDKIDTMQRIVKKVIEYNSQFTHPDSLSKYFFGEPKLYEVTPKQLYSTFKNKFRDMDRYLNKASNEASSLCEKVSRDVSNLWRTSSEAPSGNDKYSQQVRVMTQIISSGLQKSQSQYIMYLKAETHMLQYMRRIYSDTMAIAAGVKSVKGEKVLI